jgi:hypothetical protein
VKRKDELQQEDELQRTEPVSKKRAYTSPSLLVFGAMRNLTSTTTTMGLENLKGNEGMP